MESKELDVNEILKELKAIIGDQAVQIAMLKATVSSMISTEKTKKD